MRYSEQREAFKRLAIQQGIARLEQLEQALPFGYTIPQAKIDKWMNRLLEVPSEFCSQRRYVNRFKLGADPEFIFVHEGERINAQSLALAQGLAFGMDNNGRLTEIRPHPSRSALNVVASILAALRWLAILHPKTLSYHWCAGAFLMGDGIGGHVHFGRKRPGRDLEVKALDTIEEELLGLGAYPHLEVVKRRQGDGHNQHYGLPGDIRKQLHGYEYRTFPSWLDSPELAFLTITLSKLVVHNPALALGYIPLQDVGRRFQRLRNLLSYYKDVDDDARLALCIISKKFPTHMGGDFKARWGIEYNPLTLTKPAIGFIPASIKPSDEDVAEMFDCLLQKKAPAPRVPEPTWSPLLPPQSYHMAIQYVSTYQAKGLGELLWDVCLHEKAIYKLVNSRDMAKEVCFSIPDKLAVALPLNWQKFCNGKVSRHHGDDNYIYSSEKSREGLSFSECRRILLETVLPFWRIHDLKPDSYMQWRSTLHTPQKKKYVGDVLYGDLTAIPIKL